MYEQASLDVLGYARLRQVCARDEQDVPVRHCELGVRLRPRFTPFRRRPVPQVDAADAGERLMGFVAGEGAACALQRLHDPGDRHSLAGARRASASG